MFKKQLYIILLLLPCFAQAQNLVYNGSFEQYDTCPYSSRQIHFASSWFQPNKCCEKGGSSEYYNSCATPYSAGVPHNFAGYQYAKTGYGYAGLITFVSTINDYREYIEAKLIDSLIPNTNYCVEFYVSLANKTTFGTNNIGVFFSKDSLLNNDSNFSVIQVTPQVNNVNCISDTTNWVKVSGTFLASGGEKFITIGNFFNDINTTSCFVWNSQTPRAYYYIDDISVIRCADTITPPPNLLIPTYIKQQEYFYITGLPANSNLIIYNALGQIVFKENNYTQKFNPAAHTVHTGIYFYHLQLPTGEVYKGKLYCER